MSAHRNNTEFAEPRIVHKHGQRARTQHEERLLADRPECLSRLVTVALTFGLWLHPFAAPSHPYESTAALVPATAAVLSPAYADEGYDAQAGIHWREVVLDGAEFATPVPANITAYLSAQRCTDPDGTLSLLLTGIDIAQRAGYDTPDPLLLACIAKPESNFDDGAIGAAGELGLLQVHPCHERSMQRLGWDFGDGAGRVAYACVLWAASGLQPWSTRRDAQRDFREWGAK